MKILIVSSEAWRDDTNGGNVLSNIFEGIDAEFAQIYCSADMPDNKLCKRYFQITDSMVIKNILEKEDVGREFVYDKTYFEENICDCESTNKYIFDCIRKCKFHIVYAIREFAWKIANIENERLESFVQEFNPDIVFAPCYASHKMQRIDRFVKRITKKPMVSYISDDNYSLKQFQLSPIYWVNRLILRKNIRNTFAGYDLTYTMTDEQLNELKKSFNCNMKILKKSADFDKENPKNKVNDVIKLVYAGGIYIKRWKVLCEISRTIALLNKQGKKAELHIYTNNKLSKKQERTLNDKINSFVHGIVSFDNLQNIYRKSDIAIHCESFSLKNKLLTRLSFSTKIIDCLNSSCAVLAIAWNKQAGYAYLKREDAAFCIDEAKKIKKELPKLINDCSLLMSYSNKAWECGKRNHNQDEVRSSFVEDLKKIAYK